DQVAQVVITEDHVERAATLAPAVRAIDIAGRNIAGQRAGEDAAIGGDPFESALGGYGERLVRDRSFRRPEANGGGAEFGLDVIARESELAAGVAGVAETVGKRQPGMRHAADIAVAHKG